MVFPPTRYETPTHGHQFACPIAHADCINGRGWGDVVAWFEVACRLGQAVELDEFAPRIFLGKTSTHGNVAPRFAGAGRDVNALNVFFPLELSGEAARVGRRN